VEPWFGGRGFQVGFQGGLPVYLRRNLDAKSSNITQMQPQPLQTTPVQNTPTTKDSHYKTRPQLAVEAHGA